MASPVPARRLEACQDATLRGVLVLIDNYDSFTWNLVHCIGVLQPALEVRVIRNDQCTVDEVLAWSPTHLVISPGPCTPTDTGICRDLVRAIAGKTAVLGVCLGHQVIADVFGMSVIRHDHPMHGKTSQVNHDGRGLFEGLSNPVEVMRYHSLIVDRASVTDDFEVTAWSEAGEVMALRWKGGGPDGDARPMVGLQFHPESFMSPEGPAMVGRFLQS